MNQEAKILYKSTSLEDFTQSLYQMVDYVARVSNPTAESRTTDKLVKYLIEHNHWSPFEMVNLTLEVTTWRDISRQILRHRSYSFQEFSQRYAATETSMGTRECRMQDWSNRQSSLPCEDKEIEDWFTEKQIEVMKLAFGAYDQALKKGIAKECARVLLPEGLTRTKMYMNGTLRSWMHYIALRSKEETQKEHRQLALACAEAISKEFPFIKEFTHAKS